MKVIITGSSGMVGSLVLDNCIRSPKITEVVSLVRKPTLQQNSKVREILVDDFEDYSNIESVFVNVDVAFYCLGVYTGQVPDKQFKKITVNYCIEFAKALEKNSPMTTMCLLSGAGADRTEKSSTPFALYKGMAENRLSQLNLNFYSFRPAYIYPVKPRKEPNLGYKVIKIFYPLLKAFGKKYSIKSTSLANAMFNVGLKGADKSILENKDILEYQ